MNELFVVRKYDSFSRIFYYLSDGYVVICELQTREWRQRAPGYVLRQRPAAKKRVAACIAFQLRGAA